MPNPLQDIVAKFTDTARGVPSHIADINITVTEWPDRGPVYFVADSTQFVDEFGNSEWTARFADSDSKLGVGVFDRLYRTIDGITYWSHAYAPGNRFLAAEWERLEGDPVPELFGGMVLSLVELVAQYPDVEKVISGRRFEIVGPAFEDTALPSFELSGPESTGLPDELVIRDLVDRSKFDPDINPGDQVLRKRAFTLSFGVPVEKVTIP